MMFEEFSVWFGVLNVLSVVGVVVIVEIVCEGWIEWVVN